MCYHYTISLYFCLSRANRLSDLSIFERSLCLLAGGRGGCRPHYPFRERIYSPSHLPICYSPICAIYFETTPKSTSWNAGRARGIRTLRRWILSPLPMPFGYRPIRWLSHRIFTYRSKGWVRVCIHFQQSFQPILRLTFSAAIVRISRVYLAFSYIIFLRDFLFGQCL